MIYICGKTTSAWNNLSILNTPYYDNSGILIMNDAFGKETTFKRPVLVLKRIYIQNYTNAFIGIPLTTKKHNGYLFCKLTNVKRNIEVNAMLGQL